MRVLLRLAGRDRADHGARLLGLELASDRPFVELDPISLAPMAFPARPPVVARAGRSVFANEVSVAGGRARLSIWWDGDRAWLEVDQVSIGIDLAAGLIEVVDPAPPGDDRWLEHVLLGPPLLLALAQGGVFGLHAGAVRVEEGLIAFLGASGAGKSTLAHSAGANWRSFADDLLPVAFEPDGSARGLGGFPQLKLSPERRRSGAGDRLSLTALVVLEGDAREPVARRLPPAEAAAAWVAHTMIARLFSSRLLAEHLAWAAAGARSVPTWAVRFPRGLDRLDEVRGWLAERLCYPPPR